MKLTETIKVGDAVRVKGTKLQGEVLKTYTERNLESSFSNIIVRIRHENSEMDYEIQELIKINLQNNL